MKCLLFLLLAALSVIPVPVSGVPARENEVLVKWRTVPGRLDAALLLPEHTAHIAAVRPALPPSGRSAQGLERVLVITTHTPSAARELCRTLARDPRVEYAELPPVRYTEGMSRSRRVESPVDGVPDDPYYSQQWALHVIEAEPAWNLTRGAPSVVIAVVDIGVDFTHPELEHAQWVNERERNGFPGLDDDGNGFVDDVWGWDFVEGDGDPAPEPRAARESHGTHVAGIAVAARNNGRGIAGLAPDCRVLGVRVGSGGTILWGFEGVYYAVLAGARIINCAWGGGGESAFERDVLAFAFERGCVVVAAAGNERRSAPHYPAAYEGVLSVAATRPGDIAADFTNSGAWVKLSAPGEGILSTYLTDGGGHGYAPRSGTSMATALVSAACAMVAARFPTLTGHALQSRIISACDPLDAANPGLEGCLGLGRLNVWRALADSVTGVRILKVTFEEMRGNGDGRLRGGESARLWFSIFNDLGFAGDVAARISTTFDSVALTNPECLFDSVVPGGPFQNRTPVTIELAPAVGRGTVLPLSVDLLAGNRLIGRATTRVHLDSTFLNVSNGHLTLGVSENGCLGYKDYVRGFLAGAGLQLPNHMNALSHGSFLLGIDGAVVDNAYGNDSWSRFDWLPVGDSIVHRVPSTRADVEVRATFEEWPPQTPFFPRVENAVLGWTDEEASAVLVLEYTVTNRSVNAWPEGYAGLFLDWDVAGPHGDVAAYDSVSGIAYVRDHALPALLVGVASLNDPLTSLHVLDRASELAPPAIWNDARKWQLLASGFGGFPSGPANICMLAGVGPFTVAARSDRVFCFALAAGASLPELRAQIAVARDRYASRVPPPGARHELPPRYGLHPNPFSRGSILTLVWPQTERADVRVYNLLGQRVAEFKDVAAVSGAVPLVTADLPAASGLLWYTIRTPSRTLTGKLLVIR